MKRSVISLLMSFMIVLSGCGADYQPENSAAPSATDSSSVNESNAQSNNSTGSSKTQTDAYAKDLKVHFLDVGQGDSIFVELPNNETMLVDAGNAVNGPNIVNYIKDLGYDTVNYLIATHPHADHIGGMSDVVNALNVISIYMPKAQNLTQTFEDTLLTIKNKGLKINTAKAGVSLLEDLGLSVKFLAPVSESYNDLNNYSAVIKIVYGDTSFLLMGDAGNLVEDEITDDVSANVLKIGHHGSDSSTSEQFLKKVSPQYAVISVGNDNSYGHPTKAVLDRLDALNIFYFRTDLNKTVIFTSDAFEISVEKNGPSLIPTLPKAEQKKVQSSNSGSTVSKAATASSSKTESVTVYITNTGKKYHREGCRYLSKSMIPISLYEAKQGYDPCSVCNPPS